MDVKKKIGKREITLVHVAASKLGLSEDEYRAALSRVGVTTSTDLTPAKYRELMDHFKQCGFTPAPKKSSGQTWRNRKQPQAKEPLLKKIGALLLDLELPWAYADSMALRMFKIPKVLWLSPQQLHKMAAALEYHKKRQARKGQQNEA